MSWREAWRISQPAYTELAFQAIYGLRQGNLPPREESTSLGRKARRRVAQSKFLVSMILALLALGTQVALGSKVQDLTAGILDRGLYVTAITGAVLLLELALLWWTGLQILPTYLASGTIPMLQTLPVEGATLRRVALLLLLRLFDAPAATCLVLTPLAVGLALHSVPAALAVVPAVAAVIVLAIALALRTGEFFVRTIQGAHSGRGQTALRWGYLVLWAVPAFAMYGFIAIAPQVLRILATLSTPVPTPALLGVLAIFPLPFGAVPALLGASSAAMTWLAPPLLTIVGVYAFGSALAGNWLLGAPLRFTRTLPAATLPSEVTPVELRIDGVSAAIVRKDLRMASRIPGFAFLILLPLLDAVALGTLTFFANPTPDRVFNLAAAAVATSALLATFFGPALFAIEVMGYSYIRTLPLTDRSLVLGKVTMITLLYLGAATIVSVLTVARVFAPLTFLAFIAAELPGVLAAAFLEFGLLFRRARRYGLPIVNLYTGAWWATAVAVPGLIAAGLPLVTFNLLSNAGSLWAVPLMAAVGLLELGVCAPIALANPGRGSG